MEFSPNTKSWLLMSHILVLAASIKEVKVLNNLSIFFNSPSSLDFRPMVLMVLTYQVIILPAIS